MNPRGALVLSACCLGLAACSFGGPPPGSATSRANAEALAACRDRAEQVYVQQNRPAIYSPQIAVNTPSSGAYAPGVTNRGLADLYARDTMIRDCMRNTGTETDRGLAPGLRNTP